MNSVTSAQYRFLLSDVQDGNGEQIATGELREGVSDYCQELKGDCGNAARCVLRMSTSVGGAGVIVSASCESVSAFSPLGPCGLVTRGPNLFLSQMIDSAKDAAK